MLSNNIINLRQKVGVFTHEVYVYKCMPLCRVSKRLAVEDSLGAPDAKN